MWNILFIIYYVFFVCAYVGFRLVIICCQEDEGSSLLIGDLREYKRSLPPLPKEEKIVKYLQEHFVPDDLDSTSARIDPDK